MRKLRQAFTLLELIVVIVILGLLAAMVVPTFKNIIDTSKLEITEVSAASFARQTVALAGLDTPKYGGKIMQEHALLTAADMPMNTSLPAQAAQAADLPTDGRMVVFGNWEFSGNTNTLSVKLANDGARMGVAISVPNVGCAFALADGNTVTSWNVKGVDVTNCTGSGAFIDEEEIKQYGPPARPSGLKIGYGTCSPGVEGWNVKWDEDVLVDIFVNGVYQGVGKAKDLCIPGKETDVVTVVTRPNNPEDELLPELDSETEPSTRPGGVGSIGETLDDEVIEIPEEETGNNPHNPSDSEEEEIVVEEEGKTIIVRWTKPSVPTDADEVILIRDPDTNPIIIRPNPEDDYALDKNVTPGRHVYVVRPIKDGQPVGPDLPIEIEIIEKPKPVPNTNGAPTQLTVVGDTINLIWNEVPNTPTAPLTGYKVYKSFNATGPWTEIHTTSNTLFQESGLTPGQYCYSVISYGLGGESDRSQTACGTIIALPAAPVNVSVTPGDMKAFVSWSPVAGAVNYEVYDASTNLVVATSGSVNVHATVRNLTNLNTYSFYVRAVNSAGKGAPSESINATIKGFSQTVRSNNSFIVPEGVTEIELTLNGANGVSALGTVSGGAGAAFKVQLNVAPGQKLDFKSAIGGKGGDESFRRGGNGGDAAVVLSDGELLMVAGGGGGSSYYASGDSSKGGNAGHPGEAAGNGSVTPSSRGGVSGSGATSSAAGTNTAYPAGAGRALDINSNPMLSGGGAQNGLYGAGGGGAGYYGGAGGALNANMQATPGAGGGGSSYIKPGLIKGSYTKTASYTDVRFTVKY